MQHLSYNYSILFSYDFVIKQNIKINVRRKIQLTVKHVQITVKPVQNADK